MNNNGFIINKEEIDRRLMLIFSDENCGDNAAFKAAGYSILNGGKRVRPILLLEFYRMCGGDNDEAYSFALALEMIHTYSLIHDDLPCMDNDDMRRGRPSCHKAYGEDMALLAGDALLTLAFKTASTVKTIPADRVVKAIGFLAEMSGISGMIGGQVTDLNIENSAAPIEVVRDMYLKKTGALLKAASSIGCILAGREDMVEKAGEYADNVGLAFQIIDDILDKTADEKLFGKPIGSDDKNQKTTYVSKYGLEQSKKIAAELTENALKILYKFDGDSSELKRITNELLDRKY